MEEDTEELEEQDNEDPASMTQTLGMSNMMFSQMEPEQSQAPPQVKESEQAELDKLNEATREKAIKTMSRLIFFKALAGESLEKAKCFKEVEPDLKDLFVGHSKRALTNAIWDRAITRVYEVFGFTVVLVPEIFSVALPKKFHDRYYVVNDMEHDNDGTQAKKLHSLSGSHERGLLMVILSFAFCKGTQRHGGAKRIEGVRWIADDVLYRLLHTVDDRIMEEAPEPSRANSTGQAKRNATTLEADSMIQKFVHMDYLLKEKADDAGPSQAASGNVSESRFLYAMGPRALLEIGRRQLLSFTAEVLDQTPDPTMLAAIDGNAMGSDDE
jgi:hypothetical protein